MYLVALVQQKIIMKCEMLTWPGEGIQYPLGEIAVNVISKTKNLCIIAIIFIYQEFQTPTCILWMNAVFSFHLLNELYIYL